MLKENTLFGVRDKVADSISRLKTFEPEEGYYLAFSGGKDSQCIYHLAQMAGVKFDAHYTVTSVDPPELVRFIKEQYPEVSFDIPHDREGKPITMWSLIRLYHQLPTRWQRYCCKALKESNAQGRIVVTGVRWAESINRRDLHGVVDVKTQSKKIINNALDENPAAKLNKRGGLILNDDNDESRRIVEQCYRTRKSILNPIVDWEDEDVWEFLNDVAKVKHCSLYDEGFERLGCIGCPMQNVAGRIKQFERYPKYKQNYIKCIDRMLKESYDEVRERRINGSFEGMNIVRTTETDAEWVFRKWVEFF